MVMVRKNFYLTDTQDNFLKSHTDLTVSEHIRRAIDNYMVQLRNFDATTSSSVSSSVKERS